VHARGVWFYFPIGRVAKNTRVSVLPKQQYMFVTFQSSYIKLSLAEHIYEKHFIATFLKWLVYNGYDYGSVTSCAVVINVFGRVSTTNGSPFAATNPISQLAAAFSCFGGNCADNTRVSEFFILNRDINLMKTIVSPD
jgi:hypothetical protein